MPRIFSILSAFCIVALEVLHAQVVTREIQSDVVISCDNKIFLQYLDLNGKPHGGCYDSWSELALDPSKTPIKYEYTASPFHYYFPLKICLPEAELNIIAAISNSRCNTFNVEDAKLCLTNAISEMNALCNTYYRSIEIVDNADDAHAVIRMSALESDFDNASQGAGQANMYPSGRPPGGPPYSESAYISNTVSHLPKLFINITKTYLRDDKVWSTDCPCDESCTESSLKCTSFCRVLMHELLHLWGIQHAALPEQPCWMNDPKYTKFCIADPRLAGKSNSNNPEIDEICDMHLRDIDKCIFCKTVCPEKCVGIPTGFDIESVESRGNIELNIYPNPSIGTFKCKVNCEQNMVAGYLSIYSVEGELIFSIGPMTEKEVILTIDPRQLFMKQGMYLLILSSEENYAVKKLIIY